MNSDIRYKGHLQLAGIGPEGQRRLEKASVLVIGAGGLASAALEYLAAAGTGRIGIVDPDIVELSNLQRQILYTDADTGLPKAVCASRRIADNAPPKPVGPARRIASLNPSVETIVFESRFDDSTSGAILAAAPWDVALDCTDSYTSKLTVARAMARARLPYVYGAVGRFGGQVMTVLPGHACYGCLYGDGLPGDNAEGSCAGAGIFSGVVGLTAMVQACEAMKIAGGFGSPLADRLLTIDTFTMTFTTVAIERDQKCPVCNI